jgi:hypothetical protein
MKPHQFIFQSGNWIGEGRVTFSASPDLIRFYTKWVINPADTKGIVCIQEVEMQGTEPHMVNSFVFLNITDSSFEVELENQLMGKVKGKGIIDEKTIAWEFHGHGGLEGFEVYTLEENGDYMLHAEYASTDQFRTIIDGRIWKKSA